MTSRQKILRLIYPLIALRDKLKSTNKRIVQNKNNIHPHTSVINIPFELNNGRTETLSLYKGKKILIVNTASDCGYTKQYESLEKLYEANADALIIIGFPSNNFGEQEKSNDNEIEQFCKINYGVTFPLAKKSVVLKEADQNRIFQWLTHKEENGWLNETPSWNFCKYLINEEGVLTHYFESGIEPLSAQVISAIRS